MQFILITKHKHMYIINTCILKNKYICIVERLDSQALGYCTNADILNSYVGAADMLLQMIGKFIFEHPSPQNFFVVFPRPLFIFFAFFLVPNAMSVLWRTASASPVDIFNTLLQY